MRHLLIISFLLTSFIFCFGQTIKEQKFKTSIEEIIIAFSNQDSAKIAKFINKEIGVYQLHRIGAFDNFTFYRTLNFSDKTYPSVLFGHAKRSNILPLSYSSLPVWDCEKEAWSKKGLFVDTTKIDHILSKICKDRNKFVPDNIPNKKIQFFYGLETKSRRVVLYDNNGIELIFYLSYLNGNWYLTIVDHVSSDCSV